MIGNGRHNDFVKEDGEVSKTKETSAYSESSKRKSNFKTIVFDNKSNMRISFFFKNFAFVESGATFLVKSQKAFPLSAHGSCGQQLRHW